jgi:hypothetical protein
VLKAHRRVYHSNLGLRAVKKREENSPASAGCLFFVYQSILGDIRLWVGSTNPESIIFVFSIMLCHMRRWVGFSKSHIFSAITCVYTFKSAHQMCIMQSGYCVCWMQNKIRKRHMLTMLLLNCQSDQ